MPSPFIMRRRVEFRDTDAAGIAHFSVFFPWMEQAEHEVLRQLGLSVHLPGIGAHLELAARGGQLRVPPPSAV